jgi:hypothetical protein
MGLQRLDVVAPRGQRQERQGVVGLGEAQRVERFGGVRQQIGKGAFVQRQRSIAETGANVLNVGHEASA